MKESIVLHYGATLGGCWPFNNRYCCDVPRCSLTGQKLAGTGRWPHLSNMLSALSLLNAGLRPLTSGRIQDADGARLTNITGLQ